MEAIETLPLDSQASESSDARPTYEALQATLKPGMVFWAYVDGNTARCRWGHELQVSFRPDDGFDGYRPVKAVGTDQICVEVLPMKGNSLPEVPAVDPSDIGNPEVSDTTPPLATPFPVGMGGEFMRRLTAWRLCAISAFLGFLFGVLVL